MYFRNHKGGWAWDYFVYTEAKDLAECRYCGLYFRCMRTSDLRRHLVEFHTAIVKDHIGINRYAINSRRDWVLEQFTEYVHVAICKICGLTVHFKQNKALTDHLFDHGVNEETYIETVEMEPRSSIIQIPHPRKESDTAYNKFISAVKKNGQAIKCYKHCTLCTHIVPKLPYEVTLQKKNN